MLNDRPIKITLGLYFWLLLLEGVLRKWVFPGWSDVLFIIRDPLVVLIYLQAIRLGIFPVRPATLALCLIAILSLAFAFINEAPPEVILFGMRTNYLHLPLVFIMPAVFSHADVRRYGRWVLLFTIPTIWLMWLQFNADPEAWVNVGVGGGGQMLGALGHVRAPGPFSFVGGAAAFFGFVAAFVIYGWRQSGVYPRLLLIVATAAIAAAIPLSVSRTLLFVVLVVAAFGLAASARDMRGIMAYAGPLAAVVAILALSAETAYVEAFTARWDLAAGDGGSDITINVGERILNEYTMPFEVAADTPIFGRGVGLGTVAGARLATGSRDFLLAESELARIVQELGPLLGFVFIGWRVWLAAWIVLASWRHLREQGDALPWMLTGATFLSVLSGQWGPSTQLGFAVFGAGLTLSALNLPEEEEADEEESAEGEETEEASEAGSDAPPEEEKPA